MSSTILVFAECRDGEFKRSSHEAIGVARRIADGCGGSVGVVVLGTRAAAAAMGLAAYGADRILACDDETLDLYQGQAYAATLAAAVDQESAGLVLASASAMGKDVAARLAARMQAASACDLTEIEWTPAGGLQATRPVYSGKAVARVSVPGGMQTVATLRPNMFPLPAPDAGRQASSETIACPLDTILGSRAGQQGQRYPEVVVEVSGTAMDTKRRRQPRGDHLFRRRLAVAACHQETEAEYNHFDKMKDHGPPSCQQKALVEK